MQGDDFIIKPRALLSKSGGPADSKQTGDDHPGNQGRNIVLIFNFSVF